MLIVGVMAEELGGMMRLRVEDKDIDAAELLCVTASESSTGRGRKRKALFVCTDTLQKRQMAAWKSIRVRRRDEH